MQDNSQKQKTLKNLALWVNSPICADKTLESIYFNNVNMDSRKLKNGDIFVALKGEAQDGHDFIKSAFNNGAVAAIVGKKWYEENRKNFNEFCLIPVEDTLASIQRAAREYRRILRIPVIAVGGSNGKTSTTLMLKTLLSKSFKIGSTIGNFNNHIGVPLSVLSLDGDEEFAVFELGANHCGEIAELTTIIEPDMGVITNIGFDHVGLFGGIEKTAEANFELARAVSIKRGIMLLNGDDERSVAQNEIDMVQSYYFGLEIGNQIRAENLSCNEFGCYSFDYNGFRYEIPMVGAHCVYSLLPALYFAQSFGISPYILQEVVKNELKPANMRGEIEIIASRKIIADCYNANPSSMAVALKMLDDIPTPAKRIAVLGTMGELGEYEEELHKEVGASLVNFKTDKLIAVGERAKTIADAAISAGFLKENVFVCANAEEAGKIAFDNSGENDLILFKGSRSVGLEKAIAAFSATR